MEAIIVIAIVLIIGNLFGVKSDKKLADEASRIS
jgi:hypothetical protein